MNEKEKNTSCEGRAEALTLGDEGFLLSCSLLFLGPSHARTTVQAGTAMTVLGSSGAHSYWLSFLLVV